MPRTATATKPKPKAAPRKRCQWCPNFLVRDRRKFLVCANCDNPGGHDV